MNTIDFKKTPSIEIKIDFSQFKTLKLAYDFLQSIYEPTTHKKNNFLSDQYLIFSELYEKFNLTQQESLKILNSIKEDLNFNVYPTHHHLKTEHYDNTLTHSTYSFVNEKTTNDVKSFFITKYSDLKKIKNNILNEISKKKEQFEQSLINNDLNQLKITTQFYDTQDSSLSYSPPEIHMDLLKKSSFQIYEFLYDNNIRFKQFIDKFFFSNYNKIYTAFKFNHHGFYFLYKKKRTSFESITEWLELNKKSLYPLIYDHPDIIHDNKNTHQIKTIELLYYLLQNHSSIEINRTITSLGFPNINSFLSSFNLFAFNSTDHVKNESVLKSTVQSILKQEFLVDTLLTSLSGDNLYYFYLQEYLLKNQTKLKIDNYINIFQDDLKFSKLQKSILQLDFQTFSNNYLKIYQKIEPSKQNLLEDTLLLKIYKLRKLDKIPHFIQFIIENNFISKFHDKIMKFQEENKRTKVFDSFVLQFKLQSMNSSIIDTQTIKKQNKI